MRLYSYDKHITRLDKEKLMPTSTIQPIPQFHNTLCLCTWSKACSVQMRSEDALTGMVAVSHFTLAIKVELKHECTIHPL